MIEWRPVSVRVATLSAVALLALVACEPQERRPGLWLRGELVEEAVTDWSFANEHPTILLETRPWYGIRHSVTVACAAHDGVLYTGALRPESKRWVGYVARDPRVRVKIGERIYDRTIVRVTDADEIETAYRAYAAKYGRELRPPDERPTQWYFRLDPPETD